MSEYKEDPSLLEVRVWKEKCRQEFEHLSDEEIRESLRVDSKRVLSKYHVELEQVDPAPQKNECLQ